MESMTSGTLAGMGSFRCAGCGYVVTLAAEDALPACPGCAGHDFERASLFGAGRFVRPTATRPSASERAAWLEEARAAAPAPGAYLAYADGDAISLTPLAREWTRVGRSLAADLRLDDPTVSRRHALVVRTPEGLRVLDDRSLNGVFVNEERVDSRVVTDGDEVLVGRFRISVVEVPAVVAH